jgi:hypothetical protein
MHSHLWVFFGSEHVFTLIRQQRIQKEREEGGHQEGSKEAETGGGIYRLLLK